MTKIRKPEDKVMALIQVDGRRKLGETVEEACRVVGISSASYHAWAKQSRDGLLPSRKQLFKPGRRIRAPVPRPELAAQAPMPELKECSHLRFKLLRPAAVADPDARQEVIAMLEKFERISRWVRTLLAQSSTKTKMKKT